MQITSLFKATLITSLASLIVFVPQEKPIGTVDGLGFETKVAKAQASPIQVDLKPVAKLSPKPTKIIQEPVEAPQNNPNSQNHPCGDNEYARRIYQQESGCSLTSTNSIGCIGLGQSCPASKLSSACPNWRADYECQNRFFSNYAMGYGGWKQAYDFKYCLGSCYSTRTKTTTYKTEIWW